MWPRLYTTVAFRTIFISFTPFYFEIKRSIIYIAFKKWFSSHNENEKYFKHRR